MAFPVPFQLLIVLIGLLLTCGPSLALDRVACQAATPDPLTGCPSGTLLVGPDSSGASFSSVQSAILSIPNDTTPYTILILPGTYTEQLNVTRRGPLTLLGQTDVPTNQSSNSVAIAWAAVAGTGDNAYTSTLTVAPTLNASLTGAGPDGNPVPPGTPFGFRDGGKTNRYSGDLSPMSANSSNLLGSMPSRKQYASFLRFTRQNLSMVITVSRALQLVRMV
ncbi:candidate pectin methyl esterase from carbohydrate esterase family CE8 [Postia placenta Mad-698-R]|nr:candidate pectin methyl esterase from carbohydrate esterase family CE8 [Postia placenta Mad-698-R]